MELTKIEELLEKYLNASTTLQEETLLQDYFLNHKVAPHLEEYSALFTYFAKNKEERFTKAIQLNTKKRNWKWLSVAASVLFILGVFSYKYNENQQRAEAEVAYQKTQKAFQMLSKNLNKGTAAIGYLGAYQTTTNKIFKKKTKK